MDMHYLNGLTCFLFSDKFVFFDPYICFFGIIFTEIFFMHHEILLAILTTPKVIHFRFFRVFLLYFFQKEGVIRKCYQKKK